MRPRVAPCALLALGLPWLARADPPRLGLRLEAGAEYDSNPSRVEQVDGTPERPVVAASPLGRFVAAGDLAAAFGGGQLIAVSASVAGKAFTNPEARRENVLVGDATASFGIPLGRRVRLTASGMYYDVLQARDAESRDFRSSLPSLRLDIALGEGGTLSAGAGYRFFTYKPNPDFDFTAPTALIDYRHLWPAAASDGADWELGAGVSGEARGFSGIRCTSVDVCPAPPGSGAHRDRFVVAHLEAARTGAFLAGGGVAAHLNISNSYGETLLRGLLHLRAVVLLPAELSLSGRAELVVTRYREAVPLARNVTGAPLVSIEDESRSTLRLELMRPLGGHLDLGLRYTLYSNDIAAGPVHYRRQTALVFMALLL